MEQPRGMGMGGWLVKMLSLIPIIVSGIEQIHGEAKSGASKKQMAMDALGLSAATAEAVAPGQSAAIQAASQLAATTIDGVKAVYNAAKSTPAASAPAAVVSSAPAPGASPAAPGAPAGFTAPGS